MLHHAHACGLPLRAMPGAGRPAHPGRPSRGQSGEPQPGFLPRLPQSCPAACPAPRNSCRRARAKQLSSNPARPCHESRATGARALLAGQPDAHLQPAPLGLRAVAAPPAGDAALLRAARGRQRRSRPRRPCQSAARPLLPRPRFQGAATAAQTQPPATNPAP